MNDFPVILGFGSTHDLRAPGDPRNRNLAGLKSVSYAAACAMGPPPAPTLGHLGYHIPRARK